MTSKLDDMLLAERRGILPPDMQRDLTLARQRGLVPHLPQAGPPARQAEAQSLQALEQQRPEVESMLRRRGGLEDVTGGFVNRPAFEMTGATLGALGGAGLGAIGGAATGPGAPVGIPAGTALAGAAGGALGAAAGGLVFETADEFIRFMRGTQRGEEDPLGPTKRAIRSGAEEGIVTAAAGPLGVALKKLGRPLRGKAAGILNRQAARIIDIAQARGIDIGTQQLSPRAAIKAFPNVLGVFPFVAGPIKKGQAKVVGQLNDAAADMLNTLAPTSTSHDVGKSLTGAAVKRFRKFNNVAAAFYDRFFKLADELPAEVADIVPTESIVTETAKQAETAARTAVPLTSGGNLAAFSDDMVGDFLQQLSLLPDRITVNAARGLERELNRVLKRGAVEGLDTSRLMGMKDALETAKNNLDITRVPPEQAQEILAAWTKANGFFSGTRKIFETATAGRFGRVDRNIFEHGVFKAGSINTDEVFDTVFRARSPEALTDLRRLVGPREFQQASRQFLGTQFDKSVAVAREGTLLPDQFSAQKFERLLGLGTDEGRNALKEMLKGSRLSLQSFDNFLDVAKVATNIKIRDPSTFVMRRFLLGAGLGGSAMVGAGTVSLPAATFLSWLSRRGARKLMSPTNMMALTRVLSDTTPQFQKRAAFLRLLRVGQSDDGP